MTRNLIQQVAEYLNVRYPERSQYASGVAIATISSIAGNSLRTSIKTPIQTKSNVYVLLCGPSNSGKTTLINYGMDLLYNAQFRNILTEDTTTEALPEYLNTHPYALMRTPEITSLMGAYKKKQYMAGLREALIKAFDSEPLTQIRSTRKTAEAKDYSLVVLADTQPLNIAQEASETDVQSGFLPRFNWFHEADPPRVSLRNLTDIDIKIRLDLIDKFKKLYQLSQQADIKFHFTHEQLRQINTRVEPYQHVEQFHFQPFYDRVTMFVFKYAMLHMFSEDDFSSRLNIKEEEQEWGTDAQTKFNRTPVDVVMTDASVSWSIEFMQDYIQKSLPQTLKIIKLSDADKIVDSLERYKQNNNVPMAQSLLYRSVVHTMKDARRIQNAIQLAIKMEYIAELRRQGGVSYCLFSDINKYDIKELQTYNKDEFPADTPPLGDSEDDNDNS